MDVLRAAWNQYTPKERRNIMIYITGLCLYKFGLELFVGSMYVFQIVSRIAIYPACHRITLATNRFSDEDPDHAYLKVGALSGLNQTFQCIGSILIAPLIKRYHTRSVLSLAICGFGTLTAILLICDATTGGRFRSDGRDHYGTYPSSAIFPVFSAAGIAYGMVELIRRVIPRDIVGGHVRKLKQMDSMVHVFYEITGTTGAISSAVLINRWGNNYSFLCTPPCFLAAGMTWWFVDSEFDESVETQYTSESDQVVANAGEHGMSCVGYISGTLHGFKNFGKAVWFGAWVVFSTRKFIWLVPAYSFALFGHRYLENNLANIFAKSVLKESSFQQIMVGGSNFGELLGAMTVFFTVNFIPTPIPFLRLDALFLLIVWYLPFYKPPPHRAIEAWKMAATFIPISFGWAAGDVSLAAYIQASLAQGTDSNTAGISTLGAVMSFLYVTYIVTYAILSPLLGSYVDSRIRKSHVQSALTCVGGIQFTVLSGMILIATMTPRGALHFNPSLISDQLGRDFEEVKSPEQLRLGKTHITTEKDEYASSIAPSEQDTEHRTSGEVTSVKSPTPRTASPTSPTSPTASPVSGTSPISLAPSGVYNSAEDRQQRELRRHRSASRVSRDLQHPTLLETRVHMPTGIRVDLNVSPRALPHPPRSPRSRSVTSIPRTQNY